MADRDIDAGSRAGPSAEPRSGSDDRSDVSTSRTAGQVVEQFVVAELTEERARRVRLDAQGAGLITASTALSALAFGIGALIANPKDYDMPRLGLWGMAVTFVSFMVAALFGLIAGSSLHKNKVVELDQVERWRADETFWHKDSDAALREVLEDVISYLGSLRHRNNQRGWLIVFGLCFQALALIGISFAIGAVLADQIFPNARGWFDVLEPPKP